MRLPGKSDKQDVDIADYYAVKFSSLWRGMKQEEAAFWWLCIYFFFEYVRPQSIYTSLAIIPWTQISLLIACFTAFADREIHWVRNKGNVLIVLFYSIVLLSCLFAFRSSVSWEAIGVALNWLVLYFLFITVINTEKRFIIFLLLFFLVNFKMSQFGFRSYIARGFTYAKLGVTGTPGWFRDAGDLGIAMTIFVTMSTAYILALKNYWGLYKKLLFSLLPLTGLFTVMATSSRGAQLGMLAAGCWFLLKSRKGIKFLVAILAVGWLVYSLLPPEMLAEYEAAGEDSTSVTRLALWSFGMDVVRDHPVLGVGYNNWLDYCNFMNPYGIGRNTWCLAPHNTYVTALSELGITGFTMYVFLILFIFILNARTRVIAKQFENKFALFISHGLDAGLVAYLVSTTFFSNLFYPMFWVQLALAVVLYEISKKRQLATL